MMPMETPWRSHRKSPYRKTSEGLRPEACSRPKRPASTMIRARAEGLTTGGTIAVAPAIMERVTLKPEGEIELAAGKETEFKAAGLDRFGNTVKSSIRWEVRPALGTMDDRGVFLPEKAGKGEIEALVTQTRTGEAPQGPHHRANRPGRNGQDRGSPRCASGERRAGRAADRHGL